MLELREYQRESLTAIREAWDVGIQRPAIVLPTGTGKTVIFAQLAIDEAAAGRRVVILAHRRELISQTVDKIHEMLPARSRVRVGVVRGREDSPRADIIVASVPTLARARRLARIPGARPLTIIVDECHHAVASGYLTIMSALGGMTDGAGTRVVGVTATMCRTGRPRPGTYGLGDVWSVVYTRDIRWMISHGYLADVRGYSIPVEDFDLDAVRTQAGDFCESDLSAALQHSSAGAAAVEAYRDHGEGRSTILFAPTVAAAEMFTAAFVSAGIPAETITGTMSDRDRQSVYGQFAAGAIKVIASCMVLTEGFDAPIAKCAVIARPTKSTGLYVQMVGRVLRLYQGQSAVVLDIAGASRRHSLVGRVSLAKALESEEEPERQLPDPRPEPAAPVAKQFVLPDLSVEETDLFAASRTNWLQTRAGVLFVRRDDRRYLFLWSPEPGQWSVGLTATDRSVRGPADEPAELLAAGLDMPAAREAAERIAATDRWTTVGGRWRRDLPSESQLAYAERLGVDPAGMSKGALADALTMHQASAVLDTMVE